MRKIPTTEKEVEQYLHRQIKSLHGTTYKWVSPGHVGVPDRICVMPDGLIFFVEVKTLKGKISVRQAREVQFLRSLKTTTFVCYGTQGVDDIIKWLQEERGYVTGNRSI